ncbi:hypothetical protein N0V88_007477 [Collariella sp. IMI 366227]|nr:hypothetical protein N0V88_007477 [Collariella sp. IMI 366227]
MSPLPAYNATTTASSHPTQITNKVILTTGVSPGTLGATFSVRPRRRVNAWEDVLEIDVVVCNAGVMATGYELSPEGVESQFAKNHLGHWLFVNLVMEKVMRAESPRVGGKLYNRWVAYGQSKTANMLMAVELAKRLGPKGLLAFSLHPGVIWTHLSDHIDWQTDGAELQAADQALGNKEGWKQFDFKTLDQGVATTVFAAFHAGLEEHNGAYLQDAHVADPRTETVKAYGTSPVEAEMLWELSEKLAGQKFEY